MFTTNHKAKAAALFTTLLCAIAIGVSFIVDFAGNKSITWATYVLCGVLTFWAVAMPLFLIKKHRALISVATLSILTFPTLYLLDAISPTTSWFAPLALPIALRGLIGAWACVLAVRLIPLNKWMLSAAAFGGYGIMMFASSTAQVAAFLGRSVSPLINLIGIFSVITISALIAIAGYLRSVPKEKKSITIRPKALDKPPV